MTCAPCREFIDSISGGPGTVSLEPLVASGRVWLTEVLIKQLIPLWQSKGNFLHILKLLLSTGDSAEQIAASAQLLLVDAPRALVGKTFMDAFFAYANRDESVIPIGLYRNVTLPNGEVFSYVYTNPSSNTILKTSDAIYVLVNSNTGNRYE